jgi:hypothetical protein
MMQAEHTRRTLFDNKTKTDNLLKEFFYRHKSSSFENHIAEGL